MGLPRLRGECLLVACHASHGERGQWTAPENSCSFSLLLFFLTGACGPTEQRCEVSAKIVEQYPDRVPVIVERDPKARIADIDKKKFLAPGDIGMAKFISEIRKHIK